MWSTGFYWSNSIWKLSLLKDKMIAISTINVLFFHKYLGIPVVLSWGSCGTQLGFLCYLVGIPVVLSWDSCGTQLGFLWYSVGIPVVLS